MQIAGREAAASDLIPISGEIATVDLDEVLPPFPGFRRQSNFQRGGSDRLEALSKLWEVETWTGNIFRGDLTKITTLGQWDGRYPVGLPAAAKATVFVRISAVKGAEQLLVAAPVSRESTASLSAIHTRSRKTVDDRALMRVESLNPAVGMLVGWRNAGAISDAFKMAPQLAEELLQPAEKKKDPVSAAIACDFLLNVVDPKDKLWETLARAISALAKYESWLPDGAVLSASVAAIEGKYEEAAQSLDRLEKVGPPITSSGLIRAIDLIRLIIANLSDKNSHRGSLGAVRSYLIRIAVNADLSRQYLTLRDVHPENLTDFLNSKNGTKAECA